MVFNYLLNLVWMIEVVFEYDGFIEEIVMLILGSWCLVLFVEGMGESFD